MPTYCFHCDECDSDFDLVMKMSDFDIKAKYPCSSCFSLNTSRLLTVPNVNFPGDSWMTKNLRVEGQMRKKNERLQAKEHERKMSGLVPQLAPNVGGERVDSWGEARKLASERGHDTRGYEQRSRKEKST